jgi:hypothetical protein
MSKTKNKYGRSFKKKKNKKNNINTECSPLDKEDNIYALGFLLSKSSPYNENATYVHMYTTTHHPSDKSYPNKYYMSLSCFCRNIESVVVDPDSLFGFPPSATLP